MGDIFMLKLEIDFRRRNLSILVNIWDKNKSRFEEIEALFDTGAHTSAIDSQLFLNLGYDLNDAKESYIATATSSREAVNRIIIDKIMLYSESKRFTK